MKVIRIILFILNVLLAIGLLLTTLAGSIAPSRSIWPSLMAFGYLPLLAANVLMIIVWLLLKRWTFLLSTAVILLRWSFVPLFIQVGGTSRVPDAADYPGRVTLMSYNVHQFHGNKDTTVSPAGNAVQFLQIVRKYQPDVLCLQEYAAVRSLSITDSLELLGYNHYFGAHATAAGVPYGSVVFSRLPITYVKKMDHEKVMVELLKDNRHFRVCCLHLDSYRFDDADRQEIERMRRGEVQKSSRRTFEKVTETILSHETEWRQQIEPTVSQCSVPLVVAGDFNDIPSSYIYNQITRHLSDTYTEKGLGFCTTYSGGFPAFRIDWVFHSQGLNTLSYKRVKTGISDHYPVMVSLDLLDKAR